VIYFGIVRLMLIKSGIYNLTKKNDAIYAHSIKFYAHSIK